MITVIAILASALITYFTVRKHRHVAAVRRLIEQNDGNVAQMCDALKTGDWDKFDRYYWRSHELGEMIDREIERL